jgi:hypothetical protein
MVEVTGEVTMTMPVHPHAHATLSHSGRTYAQYRNGA